MALITCDHCSFSYEGHTVLQDLSLQVERGEYLCIVGENGSGKSTLIKGLLGLIAPSKGKITYEAGFHNTEIGYLPQRTEAQKDFPASVWEVVSSGCRGLNLFPTKAQRELIDRNLALMGMEDRKKSSFAELSGGQQQRALLGPGLVRHPHHAAAGRTRGGAGPNGDPGNVPDHRYAAPGKGVDCGHDLPRSGCGAPSGRPHPASFS